MAHFRIPDSGQSLVEFDVGFLVGSGSGCGKNNLRFQNMLHTCGIQYRVDIPSLFVGLNSMNFTVRYCLNALNTHVLAQLLLKKNMFHTI